MIYKKLKVFRLGTINCPDWMDRPLGILIKVIVPAFWILFVVGLAIAFSPWWLFLLLLMPKGLVTKGLSSRYQKERDRRLLEWKVSLKKEELKK